MKTSLSTRLLKYLFIVTTGTALAYALLWIIIHGYSAPWTGFGDYTKPDANFVRGKTLWDWIQLFIIPLIGSIGIFWLNRSEREADRKRTEERADIERQRAELEKQRAQERAELEREIAIDRQREAALQAYLDRMADLLLPKDLRATENEEVRNVARTRTLTVLRGLDATRKGLIVRFLCESGLIAQQRVVDLNGADLSGADLIGADLNSANLSRADLNSAKLMNAKLSGADLSRAELSSAKLSGATLSEADLRNAKLGAADLSGADLRKAKLDGAFLRYAKLSGAILSGAELSGAILSGADLSLANLSTTTISDDRLATAKSLKGATMPDGAKHD